MNDIPDIKLGLVLPRVDMRHSQSKFQQTYCLYMEHFLHKKDKKGCALIYSPLILTRA
jgi:hypothetical protein